MAELQNLLLEHITFIYGASQAEKISQKILNRLAEFQAAHPDLQTFDSASPRVTEKDAILITYGDMVQTEGQAPLQTLAAFLRQHTGEILSTIHILPFFPYSSDDGFAVIDYQQVNPDFGTWADVHTLGTDFRLMIDAVINHISAQSAWFRGYLEGVPPFQSFFTEVDADFDTSQVFRPRALPLLTSFQTSRGEKQVWTTFSEDQIDLNYRSPDLLLALLDVLLLYVAQGAAFIRLDAIAFIWKESGTSCIHLPQTHRIIQLMRTILDMVAPQVSIITETNVPHADNISYFGDGYNEAQMVYNFSLPPLTLHAFHTGNAETLSHWAAVLTLPSEQTTFFNFLASHDGIGLMPARGILPEAEIAQMAARVQALGGFVSFKNNPDGTQMAYELNTNYLDALGDPENPDEDIRLIAQRFLASQSIMLALRGVPGIYFHSLFGSRNWRAGVEQTGRYRTINRQKLQLKTLDGELSDPESLRSLVFRGFQQMLAARKDNPAFHPAGEQQVLNLPPEIFALLRTSLDGTSHTLCLTNVSANEINLQLDLSALPLQGQAKLMDALSGDVLQAQNNQLEIKMSPYQIIWLVEA